MGAVMVSGSAKGLQDGLREALSAALLPVSGPFHKQLDDSTLLINLSRSSLTLNTYRRCLGVLLSVHRPVEAEISRFIDANGISLDWAKRKKAHLLQQDVDYFGDANLIGGGKPVCVPAIADLPTLCGFLYVVEGSMLGGAHIARNLVRTLQIGPGNGGAFFHAYDGREREHWAALWAFFAACLDVADVPRVVVAASGAFQLFLQAVQTEEIA